MNCYGTNCFDMTCDEATVDAGMVAVKHFWGSSTKCDASASVMDSCGSGMSESKVLMNSSMLPVGRIGECWRSCSHGFPGIC